MIKFKSNKKYLLLAAVLAALVCYCGNVFADGAGFDITIGDIAANIMKSFKALGQLMLAISYLSGIGFVVSSIFKFKQHKDNATQIPVSTPLALLAVGVTLIFLPGIIRPSGGTFFGAADSTLDQMAGGFLGGGARGLPGADNT